MADWCPTCSSSSDSVQPHALIASEAEDARAAFRQKEVDIESIHSHAGRFHTHLDLATFFCGRHQYRVSRQIRRVCLTAACSVNIVDVQRPAYEELVTSNTETCVCRGARRQTHHHQRLTAPTRARNARKQRQATTAPLLEKIRPGPPTTS